MEPQKSNVYVSVRIRPPTTDEQNYVNVVESVLGNQIHTYKNTTFSFNKVFNVDSTQEQVYNEIGKKVIENMFLGYNCCVFAYGQTGSGKTHTIMGTGSDVGLIPRICENMFTETDVQRAKLISEYNGSSVQYKFYVSYMEIYIDCVYDLLTDIKDFSKLNVREDPKTGPFAEGLLMEEINDAKSALALIEKGNRKRRTAQTNLNNRSSRSHSILTITLKQYVKDIDMDHPREIISKTNLVDLAGSERIILSGAINDQSLREEAIAINKSLTELNQIISKLAVPEYKQFHHESNLSSNSNSGSSSNSSSPSGSPASSPNIGKHLRRLSDAVNKKKDNDSKSNSSHAIQEFINYRNSTLTYLLKNSLGGNTKTYLVATIPLACSAAELIISTLNFAEKTKKIVNKVQINQDPQDMEIRKLKDKIKELTLLAEKNPNEITTHYDIKQKELELQELNEKWKIELDQMETAKEEEIESLKLDLKHKEEELIKKLNIEKKEFEDVRIANMVKQIVHNDDEERIKLAEVIMEKNELMKKISELHLLHNVEIEELEKKHQSVLENAEMRTKLEIASINDVHVAEIALIKERNDNNISKLKLQYEEKSNELLQKIHSLETEIIILKKEIYLLSSKNEQLKKEMSLILLNSS